MDPRQNPPQNQPVGQPGQPSQPLPPGPPLPAGPSPFQQAMPPMSGQMMPPPPGGIQSQPYPAMAQMPPAPPPQLPPQRPQAVGGVPQQPQPASNPQPGVSNPKQQVVEALKGATNVLITVSDSPSVDQLAAAIGLTLMMNKLNKHATAVFSGQVPSTLEFLQPHKILESNTDSLRDFIISLDREKADKLRYKIEDNVVKIFITPYRTSISEADLMYSQGDFNVDVVIALGVAESVHLDQAISAHGRILHDAAIIGVSSGNIITSVGSINWCDPQASSLSEMLVSISESFKSGLLDTQMATAFLTGIVAETERFSNDKTSPKVMTMSAQLMAAGANQQLISTQLDLPPPSPPAPLAPLQPLETPMPALPPMPEPKKDATEFEVPQPGEIAPTASDLISLHQEEEKTEDQKIEETFGRELKTPAPAFDPQSQQAPDTRDSQIHIDENGTIVTPPIPFIPENLKNRAHGEAKKDEPSADAGEKPEEKHEDVPVKNENEPDVEKPEEKDEPHAGHELLTDTEDKKDDSASENEEEDKRNKKRRPMPLMRTHEKIIKPLAKDKSSKPKTDLKHFDFNALDSEPKVVEPEKKEENLPPPPKPEPPKVDPPADTGVMLPPLPSQPSVQADSGPVEEVPEHEDEDSARKAVIDAMTATDYQPLAESPLDALSAPAVPLDSPLPVSPPPLAGPPPPPVPPPLPMTPPPVPADPNSFTLPTPKDNQAQNPFNLPQ